MYKVGTFANKEVDNIWCTGVIHRCGFDKTSFLYLCILLNLIFDKFVFSSDEWIVMKDIDVFVQVGTADHPVRIDSMVRLSEEFVDKKSLSKMGHQQQKI